MFWQERRMVFVLPRAPWSAVDAVGRDLLSGEEKRTSCTVLFFVSCALVGVQPVTTTKRQEEVELYRPLHAVQSETSTLR